VTHAGGASERRPASRVAGLIRALRLRCPRCGIGHAMRSWFTLRESCPECRLRFERDEEEEYWLGAYTLNFIATELVFALFLLLVLVATWPNPPWRAIIWVGVIQMCLTPILFYPFAKAVWLAIDLIFRPAGPEDFR
jgi:uncharacterized protein (DUF983 family)